MRYLRYEQSTGQLSFCNAAFRTPLAVGYAGAAPHINDPDAQFARNVGPLPRGVYEMREVQHPCFAAPAISLFPREVDLGGRSGFYIHGDNSKQDRSASEGCIVLNRPTRKLIEAFIEFGINELHVVI